MEKINYQKPEKNITIYLRVRKTIVDKIISEAKKNGLMRTEIMRQILEKYFIENPEITVEEK